MDIYPYLSCIHQYWGIFFRCEVFAIFPRSHGVLTPDSDPTLSYLEPRGGCDALLVAPPAAASAVVAAAVDHVSEPHDGDVSRIGVALARHLQRLALLRRHVLRLLGDHGAAGHHNL